MKVIKVLPSSREDSSKRKEIHLCFLNKAKIVTVHASKILYIPFISNNDENLPVCFPKKK